MRVLYRWKGAIGSVFILLSLVSFAGGLYFGRASINNHFYTIKAPASITHNDSNVVAFMQMEQYRKEIRSEYNQYIESVDKKFNAVFTLLAIVVTVWVGLNIYSFIEKDEYEKLVNAYEKLEADFKKKEVDLVEIQEKTEFINIMLSNVVEKFSDKIAEMESQMVTIGEEVEQKIDVKNVYKEFSEQLGKEMRQRGMNW